MIAEGLRVIQDTAVKAASPQTLPTKSNRESRVYVNGEVVVVEKDHPPRDHVVYDIESLAAFVVDLPDVIVWHDDKRVVAVLNDGNYRDSRVTMPLPIHPTFTALASMCGQEYGQRELIDYLRLNLKKEIDASVPTFIAALRDIKIVNNSSGDSQIQHGRESMGRRIEQSVTGVDKIPEDFSLHVPLWLHQEAIVGVECALVVNTASEHQFRCGPKPGAVEQAKVAGQKWLNQKLESACENAVVYFGSPDGK